MYAERLQDIVHLGLGRAARAVGQWCEVMRASGPHDPLAPANMVMRLQVGLSSPDGRFARSVAHGQLYWQGLFDAAHTRPGDYLVRRETRQGAADGGVWFIGAQQKLLPVLCVRATRVVDFIRPPAPMRPGAGSYGGADGVAQVLLRGWPVGAIPSGGRGTGDAALPDAAGGASWTVLLPSLGGVVLRGGDVMVDDIGRRGVVASADLSDLGWRLRVREAAA